MAEINDAMKPDTVLVDESWSSGAMLRSCIEFTKPNSYYRVRGGGTIGWGMAFSVGTKLALPERPVIAVVGDGSAIFSCQSLWVAAHNDLPVTFVIVSNAGYQTVRRSILSRMGESARGRFSGTYLENPKIDFVQLAQSMGVRGQKVESPDDLREVLKSALESDKPSLVEVVVDNTLPKL